ncbi:MAG: ABC transporter ATP-binding protein [Candidatus Schekmanbacteria bacterium]|nr:ABC transporter ATP-binding protein [Candidatus Schekmanbacteria bacterium]
MSFSHFEDEDHAGRFDWRLWRRLLELGRPYTRNYGLLALWAGLAAVCDTLFGVVTRTVVDDIAAGNTQGRLVWYAAGYGAITVAIAISVYGFIKQAFLLEASIGRDLRVAGFRRLQELELSYFDKRSTGWLVARLTSDVNRLAEALAWTVIDITWGTLFILFMAAVMCYLSWKLALLVLTIVPLAVCISVWFQARLLASSRLARKANSHVTAAFGEAAFGQRTTKTLGRAEANLRELEGAAQGLFSHSSRNALQTALYLPAVMSVVAIGTALALTGGGISVLSGSLSLGSLVLFLTYARQISDPIQEMATQAAVLQSAQAAAERILALLATVPAIRDGAVEAAEDGGGGGPADRSSVDQRRRALRVLDPLSAIQLRGVSFAYDSGATVLDNLNLRVEAGQLIALVGPTGAGKTSLVNLLCRYHEPTAGEVLFNGVDYRKRRLEWLQSRLASVPQTPYLFSGTIRENLRYGRLDATDDEIERAARLARAHDFIAAMPDGYEARLGEGGVTLSAGQKQLLSLARALLADPEILVMDEATASVDAETEQRIQEGLEHVLRGRTSFVIAHRLSTVRAADRILVMDRGRIVEDGNHDELMSRGGRYWLLYTRHFQDESVRKLLAAVDA